jgi:DNA-binding NarL/FixJ family response regulator
MISDNSGAVCGQIAVAVVTGDGHRLRHLVSILDGDARLRVVRCDGSELDAVRGLATRAPEDDRTARAVVVVDVPSHVGDDVELVRSIARHTDDAAMIVVGPDLDLALAMLLAGASGVVARHASRQELRDAVACVAHGDAAVTPEVATCLLRRYQLQSEA